MDEDRAWGAAGARVSVEAPLSLPTGAPNLRPPRMGARAGRGGNLPSYKEGPPVLHSFSPRVKATWLTC